MDVGVGVEGYERGQTGLETIAPALADFLTDHVSNMLTVFFFARSPDAPRTMTTVLSFNSIDLVGQNVISQLALQAKDIIERQKALA